MTEDQREVLHRILDRAAALLEAGNGIDAISGLCQGLHHIHSDYGADVFRGDVIPACRAHGLFTVVQQDPYSARAFQKPRGYAGDAVMLDFVYDGQPAEGISEAGRAVFEGTTRTSNGLSVVYRRDFLSRLVDEVADAVPGARVCSLAAGHLREAGRSEALMRNRLQQWLAIDQDADSLEVVQRDYPTPVLCTLKASVVDLVRGKLGLEPFDLFYSAGLFDYLNDRLGTKTVSAMFDLLNPGGRLVVSNFTPQSSGRHFMQAFMDWDLIYRDRDDMLRLAADLPSEQVRSVAVDEDPYGNILYLTVVRA